MIALYAKSILAIALAFASPPAAAQAAGSTSVAPAPGATPTPNPDVLFARARAALAKRSYPRAVGYEVGVDTLSGATHKVRHFHTAFRAASGLIAARSISDEENADPTHPHGINVGIAGIGLSENNDDALGVPKLAPVYTFGLVPYAPILPSTGASATFAVPVDGTTLTPSAEAAAAFPFAIGTGGTLPTTPDGGATPVPTAAPVAQATGLRQIGKAVTVFKIYDVSYDGEVKIGDATCWHLRLKPLLNPGRYRVRDLYIDESDDQTLRMRTEGNFTLKDLGVFWDIDFAQVDGRWFITQEKADQATDGFDGITITFSDFHALDENEENLMFGLSGDNSAATIEEP